MNINDAFPSNYIKSSDLQGHTVKVVIDRVDTEQIGNDNKPVVYFQGREKGLVLNKTNGMMIASKYGPETDSWENAPIELYPDKTSFQGQIVDCVRVRLPAPPAAEMADGEESPF